MSWRAVLGGQAEPSILEPLAQDDLQAEHQGIESTSAERGRGRARSRREQVAREERQEAGVKFMSIF